MRKKLSTKQLISWAEHISMLLRSGIALSQAFEFIIETGNRKKRTNQRLLKMNIDILEAITHGRTLASALESSTYMFPPIFIHLIHIGESSGALAGALERTVSYFRMKEEVQQKILGAATYPALIACATFGIAAFLVAFIFPKIMPLFISMHVELPLPTRLLLGLSTFIGNYWVYILCGGVLLLFAAFFSYKKSRIVRLCIETLLLRLPLSKDIFQNHAAAHIFDVISMQLQSGVSLPQALSETARSTAAIRYRELLGMAAEQVSHGKPFGEELKKHPQLFSVDTIGLLMIAEQTGDIGASCTFLSGAARESIDRSINTISKLVEPVLMLGMGVVVGSIALSIIMPIYEITNRINIH